MDGPRAYTTGQWTAALLLATIFGWAAMVVPRMIGPQVQGWDDALRILLPMAVFGLPVALVLALIFVAWPLRVLMRQPVSYGRAARWALGISLCMTILSIAIGRLNGLRISRDPDLSSQIGGGDYIRSVDGILTPYGWWVLGQNSVLFVIACVLSALAIRAIIGPGRVLSQGNP